MLSERMERKDGVWQPIRTVTFQKYIFVDTSNIDDFRSRLHSIPGLTKILTVGDEAVPIYPKEEQLLRLLGGKDHIIGRSVIYKEGDKVKALCGGTIS